MSSELLQKIEELKRRQQDALTRLARLEGQQQAVEAQLKEAAAALQAEGFSSPEEAQTYVQTELAAIQAEADALDKRIAEALAARSN